MTGFQYRNGVLHAEGVSLADIAAEVGTPFYCYSEDAITDRYNAYVSAFAGQDVDICYAMKANDNLAILSNFAALGAGADVVSGGELERALAAGIAPSKIIFSGVGKTREELTRAIEAGIMQVNVESFPEMEALSELAAAGGATMEIAIRVNPNVDAETHDKISTGRRRDKFGIDIDQAPEAYRWAGELPGLDPASVAVHIGSQLTSLEPFRVAFGHVADLVRRLRGEGHDIRRVDLGGGLGIDYGEDTPPTVDAYAAVVRQTVGSLGCRILLEPGRNLVGNAGVLVSKVIYKKAGEAGDIAIVDAAMNDLIRPALYDAWHGIRSVREPDPTTAQESVDVVGPICETGDTFARSRDLPPLASGDLLVFDSVGAYGAVMASAYNARPPAPEVLVRGDVFAVVRRRQSIAELLETERLADWQRGAS
jgi:diaminopimelate decarboxylase